MEIIKEQKDYNYYVSLFQNKDYFNIISSINEQLGLNNNKPIIFVYSPPKVGSTSLISSFRIFLINSYNIIHIHDEEMLKILTNNLNNNITINELIYFNKYLNKSIYVFDIYRSPIERKISMFFEKVGIYHFNISDNIINNYNVNKVIKRFNDIFLHIGNDDYFFEKYNINIPNKFDFINNYLYIEENGIKYFKLRLKDSSNWSSILSKIFKTEIIIISDYETSKKVIKELYKNFNNNYKIPENYLEIIKNDKYLNYYYNENEIIEYINNWNLKKCSNYLGFSEENYKLYENIIIENTNIDIIQPSFIHYLDQGCICKGCNIKRIETIDKLKKGLNIDKIIHSETKVEYKNKVVNNNLKKIIVSSLVVKEKRSKKIKSSNKGIIHNNMTNVLIK